ncbi:glucose-6-phosphate isomerase [Clostridium estertheticum]|uniref:glucose-6-phosphate isomerase family protein n=1 Tax=Clostridium estertheticum TaxID=238834 RepID=UPI0013E8FF8D|nr:glucose-6-phosphate isomerase family protein [Clostridium estertheticum]MBZ9685464.1 glucose-6-phosphate isomerase [Clostridium estertheticum]
MKFNPGFNIEYKSNPLGFIYGDGTFGPKIENRSINDIRKSLIDSNCSGPEIVYSIAMDVGNVKDRDEMIKRSLLYGAVTYSKGKLGKEPVRSQGHIHWVSPSCGTSTPELYEIWDGKAIIYMQETAKDNPKRCYAVYAEAGEVVLVPPNWAHCTINANPLENMTFGAWCVRDFGFDYEDVRKHEGVAWFPILDEANKINWVHNSNYMLGELIEKAPRNYTEFDLKKNVSIYTQFQKNPNAFLFISKPYESGVSWDNFIP